METNVATTSAAVAVNNISNSLSSNMASVEISGLTEELISDISDFIKDHNIELVSKDYDIYDIVNLFLENNQSEDPFFIVNLGDIIRQYQKWTHYLPDITPYYAIKCNPDPVILKLLHKLGTSFDCASKNEIAKIIQLDIDSNKIIFANPCKMINQIKYARAHDIDLLVFDSEHELYKIKLYHSEADLVLRIKTDDQHSVCQFSCKFGVELQEVEELMKTAKSLSLNVVGVSFHVGSSCMNPKSFESAIQDSAAVFEIGKKYNFDMRLLDIGGGFLGEDTPNVKFANIAETINQAIETHFGGYDPDVLNVIAEPGRFFAQTSHTLVLSVINKKVKTNPETGEKSYIYYVNDGVYSSFFNIPMDHYVVTEQNLFPFNERNNPKKYPSTIFGPTCDSIDKITEKLMLPSLEIGEYIIASNLGAYTVATVPGGSEVFNGFNKTQCKYIIN